MSELNSAAIAAGYSCPNWQVNAADDGPRLAAESGSCSDEDVFAVYATASDREEQVDLMRDVGVLPTLFGSNWTLHSTSGDMLALQQALGGELVGGVSEPSEEPKADEPSDAPVAWDPKPKDFKVKIKVTSKKCFGSAGCNIGYEVSLEYLGDQEVPSEGTTDITYEISGAEQEVIGTIELNSEGQYSAPEDTTQTSSSSKKLVAKVTEVDYNESG